MKRIMLAAMLTVLVPIAATAQEILTGPEIRDILVGNTLEADYQEAGECRHTFYEYFSEDGKIYGRDKRSAQASGYTKYLGTWEVKDDEFCTNVGYGHRGGCSVFEKVDEDTYIRKFDGLEIDRVKVHKGRYRPCS